MAVTMDSQSRVMVTLTHLLGERCAIAEEKKEVRLPDEVAGAVV